MSGRQVSSSAPVEPVTRARAKAHEAHEVDALVEEIARMMAAKQWVVGASHDTLALREGVTVGTVEKWSAQAGRYLRIMTPEERRVLQARNASRFDQLYELALTKQVVIPVKDGEPLVIPQPDVNAARAVVADQDKLLGLNAPDKVDHRHEVAPYEALAPRDRLAQVREAIAALRAEEEALVSELALTVEATTHE